VLYQNPNKSLILRISVFVSGTCSNLADSYVTNHGQITQLEKQNKALKAKTTGLQALLKELNASVEQQAKLSKKA